MEEEEMIRKEWGEDEQVDEDEEVDEVEDEEEEEEDERAVTEREIYVQRGGEASKVRRRTFFDIFEDDQLDDGESLHRDITIILFVDIMHTLWCLPHERIRFWAK